MRYFIALEIPEESKQQLAAVQKKLKQIIPNAKLTDNEKLHLTIAFIGKQPEEFKDKLVEIMQKATQGIGKFIVTPSYIDGFPHLHTASTLWIGVKGDIDKLYKLRHHLKDQIKNLGLPPDQRRFVPHIAIAKLDNFMLDQNMEQELEGILSIPFSPILIESVKLFESIPQHGFHSHNTLAEIKLG